MLRMALRIVLIVVGLLSSGCKLTGSLECRFDDPTNNLQTVSRLGIEKEWN